MAGGRTREYEEARERIDRAIRPYVKVRVWKPEEFSLEELEAIKKDERFLRKVSRLARLYMEGERRGETVIVALTGVGEGELSERDLEALLDDVEFREELTDLIRERAGRRG